MVRKISFLEFFHLFFKFIMFFLYSYSKQNVSGQDNLDHPGFKAAAIMALSKLVTHN